MKMTKKENINVNSIVLKHKIALETITLLEGRENLLYTDMMIYTMVSFVDVALESFTLRATSTRAVEAASFSPPALTIKSSTTILSEYLSAMRFMAK